MPWTAADWVIAFAFPALTAAGLIVAWRRGPLPILIVLGVSLAAAVAHAAMMGLSALPAQWAVISFAAGVCRACRFRTRTIAVLSAGSLSVCGLLLFGAYRERQRQLSAWLWSCPVSEQQRWWVPQDYDPWTAPATATVSGSDKPATASLTAWERTDEMPLPARAFAELKEAHAQVTNNFIASAGFGIGRMLPMPKWPDLCLTGTCPSPLPEEPELPAGVESRAVRPVVESSDGPASSIASGDASDAGPAFRWVADRVQLVSLLKHRAPRVYDVQGTPTMEQLKSTPTRDPDGFEEYALGWLERGEDVVVSARRNSILMVGALRAEHSCLTCHPTTEKALLGAFTYRLVPRAKAAPPVVTEAERVP